jgi:protein gp37
MAEKSEIQWTQNTWNPWHGCAKVSDGCKYCYMYRDKERYGQDPTTVLRSKSTFFDPLKWKEPKLIFTCSWSDWFIKDADEWRDEAWRIIKNTPQHTYQILTKRPENIPNRLPTDWGDGYENVLLGVSIENEKTKNRLLLLHEIKNNRSLFKTFVSAEPLLEHVEFHNDGLLLSFDFEHLDWLIVGGESGNLNGKYKYRPCELSWIRSLVSQCKDAGVPVFVKQFGTYLAKEMKLKDPHGGDITEFPIDLQVREFPINQTTNANK